MPDAKMSTSPLPGELLPVLELPTRPPQHSRDALNCKSDVASDDAVEDDACVPRMNTAVSDAVDEYVAAAACEDTIDTSVPVGEDDCTAPGGDVRLLLAVENAEVRAEALGVPVNVIGIVGLRLLERERVGVLVWERM